MARGGNQGDERERVTAFPFSLHSPSLAREARVPPAIWLLGTPVLTQNVPGVALGGGGTGGDAVTATGPWLTSALMRARGA